MINNFVAFDFETASGKAPCSIGIVEFNDGEVVNEYYSLINPKIEKFNPYAVGVHGIRKCDVLNEREFDKIWVDVEHFFKDKIVIAHNSSFDISVLNYSLERYNLKNPISKCFCSLRLSRKVLELDDYKLSTLADYYSIEQNNYHNALEDAFVCGKIFSKLLLEIDDVNLSLISDSIMPIKRKKLQKETKPFKLLKEQEQIIIDLRFNLEQVLGILTNKLASKTFVVSGVFQSVSRNELKKLIEDNGGKVSSSISSKTSFVVAGDNMGPSKRDKAEKLGISIISEQDFLDMII
nr:exonuclease domain-containing protein [Hanstruepera ponticola]